MPTSWPEVPRDEPVPTSWPESGRIEPASGSWPEAPRAGGSAPAWPEQSPPARDPLPAWSNLSSPAPWPPRDAAATPSGADPLGIDPSDPLGAGTSPSHPRLDPLGPGTNPSHPRLDPLGSQQQTGHPGAGHPQASDPRAGDPLGAGGPAGSMPPQPGHGHLQHGPMGDGMRNGHAASPGGPGLGAPGHGAPGLGAPGHGAPGSGAHGQGAHGQGAHGHGGPSQGASPQGSPGEPRPGANLSRDPSDPDNRFVTAGQISGSRTPPPERQQELWDTVFGDNYEAMGEDDDGPGKPVWIYALAGSVAIALVAALLWAFLAGPLASETSAAPISDPTSTGPVDKKPPTKKPSVGRLPRFQGEPSPVTGVTADATAGISVPRLGGPWKPDLRSTMKSTYGYSTRQFALAGTDAAGKEVVAQVMTGPLPAKLAGHYASPDNLEPVIKAVVVSARKLYFSTPNSARKTATQALKVGGMPAQLNAYEVTVDGVKTTVVAAAISTGADVPAIVYMSVPTEHKELLPDINSVFRQIKPTAS
ncbi:hypothetical protein ACFXJ8_31565 [Nonomuraea sp. NPDC059194]|uniref:hypothetical protein n=1 Tax=Nonomuraea sp. NPDC059194 TaxID=3346764 RepID=UPI003684BEA8